MTADILDMRFAAACAIAREAGVLARRRFLERPRSQQPTLVEFSQTLCARELDNPLDRDASAYPAGLRQYISARFVESPVGSLFVAQYGRKDRIAPGTPVAITFVTQRGVCVIPGV